MGSGEVVKPGGGPARNRVEKVNRKTYAARWNLKTLYGLQLALKKDPEADIVSLLGPKYSEQLLSNKKLGTPRQLSRLVLGLTDYELSDAQIQIASRRSRPKTSALVLTRRMSPRFSASC